MIRGMVLREGLTEGSDLVREVREALLKDMMTNNYPDEVRLKEHSSHRVWQVQRSHGRMRASMPLHRRHGVR